MEHMRPSLQSSLKRAVLFAGAFALGGAAAFGQEADATITISKSELDDLRRDFNQMRAMYEARISELEAKIHTVSVSEDAQLAALRAQESALKASEAADKASEMYSSTISSMQQSAELAKGDWAPWITFDDMTKGFEFHGYMRSGFGVNSRGGAQEIYQVPFVYDVFNSRYRLGNEDDTSAQLNFINNFLYPEMKEEGVKFKTVASIAFSAYNGTSNSETASKKEEFTIAQAYAEAEGVWSLQPKATFWAGQRTYMDEGIHINKLHMCYYNGYGGGIDDVELFDGKIGKLGFAWLGGSLDNLNPDGTIDKDGVIFNKTQQGIAFADQNLAKNTFILSFKEIITPVGQVLAWGSFATMPHGSVSNGTTTLNYAGADGFGVGGILKTPVLDGFNQFTLQYGIGAAANFQAEVRNPFLEVDGSRLFLVSESFVIQPMKELSIAALLSYVHGGGGGTAAPDGLQLTGVAPGTNVDYGEVDWISVGARPVWHFNKYFSVAIEGGIDWAKLSDVSPAATQIAAVKGQDFRNRSGTLYKLTIAPQITPNWNFWARPSIRFFVTAAYWTKQFEGYVGVPSYINTNKGLSAGMQFEAWW
jgi:maltoporin